MPAPNAPAPAGRTRRSPENIWIEGGAVRQHDGKLPLYICNACNREVVWVTSTKTGRAYLVNISHGQNGHRFYIGSNVHNCAEILARRADDQRTRENAEDNDNEARYLFHLMDVHELQGHPTPVDRCHECERDARLAKAAAK